MPEPRIMLRALLVAILAALMSGKLCAQSIVYVDITGIDKELETNVRLFLSIDQQREHPLMSDGRVRRLHQKANKEISAALQPYGFYRPQITSTLTELETGLWRASYVIEKGPGLPIAEINLEVIGALKDDPAMQPIIDRLALRTGSIFEHPKYERFKSAMRGLMGERGYMEGEFTRALVEIDLNAYVARVYLDIDSGPRYSFGEVSLEQDVLEPELLQRYIPFKTGDPYSLDQVLRLQQALHDSNYFTIAEVSPGTALVDSKEVPIYVTLTPRKRHRYNFGLGYGTDTGARAKFGWRMPRVNEKGHRLDTGVEVSEIGYKLSANYRIPVLNPRTDQLVYSINKEREDTDTSDSTLTSVGVSLNHNRAKWREVLSLAYEEETFEVGNDSGDSYLLIPGISWSRTWGPDFINVIDGVRLDIGVRGASEAFVSETDFIQMRGNIKFITSISPRNRFLIRGGFGTTETPDFHQLPSSIRFFAGGSQSVRGYAYEDLGPTNDDGDVVGGRHLLTGSIEFEHFFDDGWGAAVFLDTGNAIDNLSDDLEQGAGFGLRWKSPIGPVRIDLANAISTDDKDWRLHVSIGPDL